MYYLINNLNGYAIGVDPSEQIGVHPISVLKDHTSIVIFCPFRTMKEAKAIIKALCLSEPEWKIQNYLP